MRYYFPCDPECPVYAEFHDSLVNDPMTKGMGAPVDDIMMDFSRKHQIKCVRCREYGATNVEVE